MRPRPALRPHRRLANEPRKARHLDRGSGFGNPVHDNSFGRGDQATGLVVPFEFRFLQLACTAKHGGGSYPEVIPRAAGAHAKQDGQLLGAIAVKEAGSLLLIDYVNVCEGQIPQCDLTVGAQIKSASFPMDEQADDSVGYAVYIGNFRAECPQIGKGISRSPWI